ncbi:uncharacterized protein LOC127277625 [Leptopilina boulardi]|uniref:uncharacterized protein LOC127277625 n=1 Tax=Leptopilina boulardi TaxID=63433 RepID=UPI0021F5C980|nr:uncharacterized protein LOC127277625 [Leptopilina boulardi]
MFFNNFPFIINLFGFLLFFLLIFYIYSQYKLNYWKRKGIPTPNNCHWLFGNFKDVILGRTSVGVHFGKLHNECCNNEPCLGVYIMHKPFLLLRDPELIKQILVKDFHLFQNRYFAAEKSKDLIGTTSLFSINNPEWKYLRTKLSSTFSSGKQKKLFSLMIESSENMSNFLAGQFQISDNNNDKNTKNIDTKFVAVQFITDVISSLAFGVRTNSFGDNLEFFNNVRAPFKRTLLGAFQLFAIFFFPIFRNFLNSGILGSSTDYFRNLFREVMNEREKSGFKRGDSIDPLLQIKQERHSLNFEMPDDTLLAQPVIFYVAGTESSSTTIALTLMEFAKNPILQERARREIQNELDKHGFTYEGMQGLKFLQQAISETLRLYPAAPIIDRVALEDYKIPGTEIVLEKGTVVYVALNGIQEDPRFFKDPLKYDPDRFSEERKGDIVSCSYLPFGEGPRACIGERVGMLQTTVGLATILRDYEVSLNPKCKYELDPRAIFIQPLDGVKLDLKKVSIKIIKMFSLNQLWLLNVFLIIFGLLTIFYFYAQYKYKYWKKRGVKSLPTHWLFGNFKNLLFLRESVANIFHQLHRDAKDESYVGVYIFQIPCLLVRSPELIKQILVKDFNIFPNRQFASSNNKNGDQVGATSLFSVENPRWKYFRTHLSPIFSSGKQKKIFTLMIESAENMRNYFNNQLKNEGDVKMFDVKEDSNKYITDIISSMAFGISTNSFEIPTPEFFKRGNELFQPTVKNFIETFTLFFFPSASHLLNPKLLGKSTEYFRNIFWESMNHREKSGTTRGDSIDVLLKIKNERVHLDMDIPDDSLLGQSGVFFVAGRETSSMSLGLVLYELAKRPTMQDRVRKEITEKINEKGFCYESMQEMKYLNQVISEVLRMYPVVPIIDRVAEQNYKIPGTNVVIEKGTPVYTSLHALHFDPEYHPNPYEFDPDRFSDERKSKMVPYTYMPFGEGPRICIGMRFAILQMTVGLAVILRDFQVALNPAQKVKISNRGLFLQTQDGIKLDLKKVTVK